MVIPAGSAEKIYLLTPCVPKITFSSEDRYVFIYQRQSAYCIKRHLVHRYTREIQNLRHFDPVWGSNWASLGFAPNQNNCGSSGVYVTCRYCCLSVNINMCKMLQCVQISSTHLLRVWFLFCFVLFFFLHVWSAKTPGL